MEDPDAAELARTLDLACRIAGCEGIDELRHEAVQGIPRLVPCDDVSFRGADPLDRHQVELALAGARDTIACVTVRRARSEFSPRERALLELLRPHLAAARRRVLAPVEAPGLTPRQTAILARVAEGLANKEIAAALGISPRTVEKHLERTYRKLGASNRTAAVARARSLSRAPA